MLNPFELWYGNSQKECIISEWSLFKTIHGSCWLCFSIYILEMDIAQTGQRIMCRWKRRNHTPFHIDIKDTARSFDGNIFKSDISTVPPRLGWLLKRKGLQFSLSIRQERMVTLRMPPDISLPIATPPWPYAKWQFSIRMFSLGRPTLRPSSSRPDLMEMQSSCASMRVEVISISLDESISMPSELGIYSNARISIPSIVKPFV